MKRKKKSKPNLYKPGYGARILQQRLVKGWGPDQLAEKAGISRTALYQLESEKTAQPRARTIERVARALGVSVEYLLNGNAPEAAPEVSSPAPVVQQLPVFGEEISPEFVQQVAELRASRLSHPLENLVRDLHGVLVAMRSRSRPLHGDQA